ncbi:ATP-binding protein [Chryseolinea sp. T2]|uniref:sensor histidine kinase n=1 Tax=Chryseolinea sp. T2 TaxID=3129255 RepID=UPI0030787F57
MLINFSNRVLLGLLLIAGLFFMDLVFTWGDLAYLLAAVFIFTTPGKFFHGVILGLVTNAFIILGYFVVDYPPSSVNDEITIRVLLLFSVSLAVIARIRNNPFESAEGQIVILDSAIAEREEALAKLTLALKEREDAQMARNEVENELQKARHLHEAMAHHFPDGVICVLDQNMRYTLADGRGLEALGLNKQDVKGEYAAINAQQELKRAFQGEDVAFETVLNHEVYTVNAVPIPDGKGDINEILVVIRNITDRKKLENNLLKALDKEKELNLLMSQFVTMASHKFRTPLSTILSSVFLLENNVEADDQERKSYFDKIKRAVHNVTGLLNDFLSLGKLEEGKVKVAFSETEIKSFFQEFLQEVGSIKKAKQRINFTYDGVACTVMTDQLLLKNILMSLLSNAIEYSAFDAEIDLAVELKQDNLKIRVSDHGIGIPEEEQHQVFRRFYRGQNANNIEGTGLGLNIAKKYIRLLKGTIEFTSQVNKGTTFIANIPVVTLDILEKQA